MRKELSDMDYLKSKAVRAPSPSSSEEEESEDEAVNCDEGSEAEDGDSHADPARQAGDGTGPRPEQEPPPGSKPREARAEVRVGRCAWGPGEAVLSARRCHLGPQCVLPLGSQGHHSSPPGPSLPGLQASRPLFSFPVPPALFYFLPLLVATAVLFS